jgi:proline iminopeptidase
MSKTTAILFAFFSFVMGSCSSSSGETEEGYISVTGGRVWYQAVGNGKEGVPLLVVHGGPGVPHDYLEPLAELADERPVVFYDQLGCGNSDKPEDTALWTIERFVDELHRVRTELGLEKVHILGQSWGTALAVDYLLEKHPEGVVSLVLSGPLLSTSRWIQDQNDYIAELPPETRDIILECESSGDFNSSRYQEAMMTYYGKHVCRIDPWPECLNRSFEKLNFSIYEYMWGPSEFTVTGVLKNYERVHRLNDIAVPVLFTCGRYDEATPETTQVYRDNLPGSEIFIFENASHEHHLEQPQKYLQVVRNFLNRVEKDQP